MFIKSLCAIYSSRKEFSILSRCITLQSSRPNHFFYILKLIKSIFATPVSHEEMGKEGYVPRGEYLQELITELQTSLSEGKETRLGTKSN